MLARSDQDVAMLVVEHEKLIEAMVNQYLVNRYTLPGMERNDLVSWGRIGLLNAARTWDPDRGAFSTHACTCIRRSVTLGASREGRHDLRLSTVSLDQLQAMEVDGAGLLTDALIDRNTHYAKVEAQSIRRIVREALRSLKPDELHCIVAIYFDGCTAAEYGRNVLGLDRHKVTTRLNTIRRKLRKYLLKNFPEEFDS